MKTSVNPSTDSAIDLRTELRKEFVRRCKANEAYSLRAFASYLEVDQSLLSKIMNGQRAISMRMTEQLAFKLKIDPVKVALMQKTGGTTATLEYAQLVDDQISVLSDWTHYAILELAKTKDFKADAKWIAKRFGVRAEQIEDALERLERMKMIIRSTSEGGPQIELLQVNNDWTNTTATSLARKELQRVMLELSQTALQSTPFDEREHGSLTVAIKKSRMPEFKKRLKEIRDELDAYFQPTEDAPEFDEVYQLTLSLFPLTKKLK